MQKELEFRLGGRGDDPITSIYFGGGTPSLLKGPEIEALLAPTLRSQNPEGVEITLEANPDDIDRERLNAWKKAGINRLSIGVQSFYEEDLRWMNRSHSAGQAENCLQLAAETGFDNINLDLIFGYPLLSDAKWEENIRKALSFPITHLSTYSMTVEDGTALHHRIARKKERPMEEGQAERQYRGIMHVMKEAGWAHYEVSNFCKPGHPSIHNSSYWEGATYLGIGPSAHGYDGKSRYWNLANNAGYIAALQEGRLAEERELLSDKDRYNEFLLTRLRTAKGLNRREFATLFGDDALKDLEQQTATPELSAYFLNAADTLKLNQEGFLLADHLISQLFLVDSE